VIRKALAVAGILFGGIGVFFAAEFLEWWRSGLPTELDDILVVGFSLTNAEAIHLETAPLGDSCEIRWAPVYRLSNRLARPIVVERIRVVVPELGVAEARLAGDADSIEILAERTVGDDAERYQQIFLESEGVVFAPNQTRLIRADLDLCLEVRGERRALDADLVRWLERADERDRPALAVVLGVAWGLAPLSYDLTLVIDGEPRSVRRTDRVLVAGMPINIPPATEDEAP
jgi:hypothetical protein